MSASDFDRVMSSLSEPEQRELHIAIGGFVVLLSKLAERVERAQIELREIERSVHTLSPQELVIHCRKGLGEPYECDWTGEVPAYVSPYDNKLTIDRLTRERDDWKRTAEYAAESHSAVASAAVDSSVAGLGIVRELASARTRIAELEGAIREEIKAMTHMRPASCGCAACCRAAALELVLSTPGEGSSVQPPDEQGPSA